MNDLDVEEVGQTLARLLTTPELRISDRKKRFLRYIVEETLAGRGDRIKSYSIALDVFGRSADFDGVRDSIVRTEATRLRSALAAFYKEAGANDPVRILIPPGAYVPRFERVKSPPPCHEARPVEGIAKPSPAQAVVRKIPAPAARPAVRLMALARAAAVAFAAFGQVLDVAAKRCFGI
jgi:hypothetical protein